MNKYQIILIERYKYHDTRANMSHINEQYMDVAIRMNIMEEIQTIYYLMFKSDIVKDITMNGEI